MGLPVATGVDAVMQLHGQRLETLLLQQGRQILKQPFGAGFAEATFGGELPAGGGAHKDCGRWIVDGNGASRASSSSGGRGASSTSMEGSCS